MLIAKKIMVSFIVILTLSVHSSEIRTIKQGPDKETYFPVDMNTLVEQLNEDKNATTFFRPKIQKRYLWA
ncbi:hypothetical protein IQ454_004888 [Salmonella enterica]|nr:hypothetical protein [Salmonella enterica]EGL4360034.1 hypothetical protein [Salmonella enterica]EGL4383000.1 hypothetical protein [Salmonella enterica]EGL4488283.1 hypothetical protein [Salmonella enterica]EGL4515527.1 hypothetical protein [Salmonella enterica]